MLAVRRMAGSFMPCNTVPIFEVLDNCDLHLLNTPDRTRCKFTRRLQGLTNHNESSSNDKVKLPSVGTNRLLSSGADLLQLSFHLESLSSLKMQRLLKT